MQDYPGRPASAEIIAQPSARFQGLEPDFMDEASHSMTGARPSWLVPLRCKEPGQPMLVGFPHAGGRAFNFRSLAAALPRGVGFVGIDLPGRGANMNLPLFTRIAPVADALTAFLPSCITTPFALLGHSVGALIAFEVAHRLACRGGPQPVHLFVSGCPGPRRASPVPSLSALPRQELIAHLRDIGGTSGEVLANDEILDLVLPTLRADLALADHYSCDREGTLSCPIAAFGGTSDPVVQPASLRDWARETNGTFTCTILPGNHFSIYVEQPALTEFASAIVFSMTRAAPQGACRTSDSAVY